MTRRHRSSWNKHSRTWLTAVGISASLVACGTVTGQEVSAEAGASGWTLRYDFNDGSLGEKVAGLDAGGRTTYTDEQVFEGEQAASLRALRGKENFGGWGGRMMFPEELGQGDEIWWRVRTYWPEGMDYSASPRLKFLRIHTKGPDGSNHGYNDLYINTPGSSTPFNFIYEGEAKWSSVGEEADAIAHDTWETYELYLKLDDRSVDDGGEARIRIWKGDELLADITDRKTLKTADDTAEAALLFTYWNSSPYMGQIHYEGETAFEQGETVVSDSVPDAEFRAERVGEGVVYLQDPTSDWRERVRPFSVLEPGDKLIGRDSGQTVVVTEVLHSHPLMDIRMFVDDIVVTTVTPKDRDDQGNPRIATTTINQTD